MKKSYYSLALALGIMAVIPAHAIWHPILTEHFNQSPPLFPWQNWTLNPARTWYQSGPPYVWGVQDEIYKMNGLDTQSIWCCGLPPDLSPSQDLYPSNMNAWAKWGPIDLSQAVAAVAIFSYFCVSEPDQDYMRWGAWGSNAFNMYEAGRYSGTSSSQWYTTMLNFDSLAGGTQSLLGDNSVWIEFHFVSDGDNQRYIGGFIDELGISWDDGILDFAVQASGLANPDSTPLVTPQLGDSICFSLAWTAEGSGTTPNFDINCYLDGTLFYSERRNVEIGLSQLVGCATYSHPWVVLPGLHSVMWMLDASQEIVEASELNNDTTMTFLPQGTNVPPWIEITRPTWGDTAASEFVIRWQDEDPDDNASVYLYWRFDTLGTGGTLIPGALGIPEDDEGDSLLWNLSNMPEEAIWVFALIIDESNIFFDFSEGPLIIDHDWLSVEINLNPINPPIIIPQNGGQFSFEIGVENHSDLSRTFDAWLNIELPNGAQFTSLGPVSLTLPPYFGLLRSRVQQVPSNAPSGNYAYWGFLGTYPWNIVSSDSFAFTKQGTNQGWQGTHGWTCTGEPLTPDSAPFITHHSSLITSVSPNPFNAITAISFQLQAPSHTSLRVYDTAGRLVGTLVDGWREAGQHEVAFDGTHLPSGIYLYRIEAGSYSASGKMLLLK